ncbi:MAG TPA: DNA polymerase III subunit alpha [Erysipelotrichaceae bacterium]|nr:DNA polymerase III subunit alpha [Erysipelotrichaceae bacterium]
MNDFVPLRIISDYSFLKSGLTMERIKLGVYKNDYYGLGLCDIGVMYGVPAFIKTAEELNRPYVIGMEVELNDDVLCLYVKNETGYRHLMKLATALSSQSLDIQLLKKYSEGLIGVIETSNDKFKTLFKEDREQLNRLLFDYDVLFKSNFYLGISVTSKEEVSYANEIRNFVSNHPYNCVAFPKIRYLKTDDAIVLSIVEAIATEEEITIKKEKGQDYFMSFNNYQKIYTPKEIRNTREIVEATSFSFHQKRGEMLHYPVDDASKTLKTMCRESLKDKGLETTEIYQKRLDYELETIINLGYADYFLIVHDFVSYAKNNDILVGPGRGSAAGSLVSYLLNITEIDPIKEDLQFERFLNPHRQTMPDIDVDFMDIKRNDVVEYVREKYGNSRVANIVTYQTIQAKQALRDIGRVYNFPTHHIDLLSKRLSNPKLSLRQAYRQIPEFKKLVDSDEYFLQIVSLASKIEGLIRQNGLHPAGVILNHGPLEEVLPLSIDFSNNYISQYELNYLEDQGFLKIDFLALRNLTTISYCVDLINDGKKIPIIDKFNIPYDEKEVYEFIASGQTLGIFQLESSGIKRAISVLKPSCFDDIIALLALYRPGPMDSIPSYGKRKEGKEKITYDDPCLEKILKPTYGIIVYQEQVNEIARVMAGFSMAEADLFRRAITKKDAGIISANEKAFIEGSIKNGHSETVARKVFNNIKKFAGYGFNKSHPAVYAIITCRTAFLKLHYPLEFYAAILETASGTSDTKFSEYVSEMKKRNIKIIAPNINASTKTFLVYENGLLFPLSGIKGINNLLVDNIINERKEKPFTDFFDFVSRMYNLKINDEQIVRLIDAGCFDSFNPSRASLRATVKSALQFAELTYKEDGQLNIGFSAFITPYTIEQKDDPIENLNREYEVLGMMISNNPLYYKKEILAEKNVIPIVEAKYLFEAKIAGLIKDVKKINTKKGSTMAFVKLLDETDEIEITVFPDTYANVLDLVEKNNLVVCDIKRKKRQDDYSYIADNIYPLEDE